MNTLTRPKVAKVRRAPRVHLHTSRYCPNCRKVKLVRVKTDPQHFEPCGWCGHVFK